MTSTDDRTERHHTDGDNCYEDALKALECAGDQVERALNLLAACDNYDRRSELLWVRGVIRGATRYYIELAGMEP